MKLRSTKIVATIGPSTESRSSMQKLKKNGMDLARLNGSHNDLKWHSKIIKRLKKELPDIPILFDIPGKKIRTLKLNPEPKFKKGDTIVLTTNEKDKNEEKIKINNNNLHKQIKKGQRVLADDGTLKFRVIKINGRDIYLKAQVSGQLKSFKGINVPNVNLSKKLITKKDIIMIRFAKKHKIDFIGLSFVESKKHVQLIKKIIGKQNSPKIVSKIENKTGFKNMTEVISSSDVIMIDRGDLSVETQLESIALKQKEIIKNAKKFAVPVIVATELLHSMITQSFPTKAEVSDIGNAVLDGASAVMLSGETAIGKFPYNSINLMRNIILKTENYFSKNKKTKSDYDSKTIPMATSEAINLISKNVGITKIIAITRSGYAAKNLSNNENNIPIVAVTDDQFAVKSFNILPRVKGVYFAKTFSKIKLDHMAHILKFLWQKKIITIKDNILITTVAFPSSGNRMNLIQTHYVKDLKKTFKWK